MAVTYGVTITGGIQLSGGVTFPNVEALVNGVEVLVIAAGGSSDGAGSGAGGLIDSSGLSFEVGSVYTITIGAVTANANGGNTSLTSSSINLVAIGGGRGGTASPFNTGSTGGSGGGSSYSSTNPNGAAPLQPSSASGGRGGYGSRGEGSGGTHGGSGGGASGEFATGGYAGGVGGRGFQSNITGTLTYYAGGGTGTQPSATRFSNEPFGGGYTNYGGGGDKYAVGGIGVGGPGVVFIKYPSTYSAATVTGTVTVSTVGSNRLYTFTGNGTIVF